MYAKCILNENISNKIVEKWTSRKNTDEKHGRVIFNCVFPLVCFNMTFKFVFSCVGSPTSIVC